MKNIFAIYFAIGVALGVPMSLSYMYTQMLLIWDLGFFGIFSFSGLIVILYSSYLIIVAPIVRAIIWLPSLIIWFYTDGGQTYSFFKWLAPGFYYLGPITTQ